MASVSRSSRTAAVLFPEPFGPAKMTTLGAIGDAELTSVFPIDVS
jgi:hypothetical protein